MMEGNSKQPPPFLLRTYEIVDDPLTDAVVSWSLSGLSFVVWNPPEFATDLLPKHFKHNNFSSFIRQLNTYGFRKVDPEQWEFSNEEFVRGRKHLLRNINRRKPVYSHNKGQPNPERDEFLRTIKRLEQENQSLQSELEKHRLDNREYESHLGFLWQILNDIDQRQRQLMAGRSRILKPESPSKRRRLLTLTHLRDENRELSMGFLVDEDHLVESLDLNAGCLQDDNSSNDHSNDDSCLGDSMGPAPGSPLLPPISSICMDLEMMDKLDENETMGSARPAGGADREANDVFWQQFLNEAPDSWVMQAV